MLGVLVGSMATVTSQLPLAPAGPVAGVAAFSPSRRPLCFTEVPLFYLGNINVPENWAANPSAMARSLKHHPM